MRKRFALTTQSEAPQQLTLGDNPCLWKPGRIDRLLCGNAATCRICLPPRSYSFVGTSAANSSAKTCEWLCSCFRKIVSRSEEHTSELQSHVNLVCRLL